MSSLFSLPGNIQFFESATIWSSDSRWPRELSSCVVRLVYRVGQDCMRLVSCATMCPGTGVTAVQFTVLCNTVLCPCESRTHYWVLCPVPICVLMCDWYWTVLWGFFFNTTTSCAEEASPVNRCVLDTWPLFLHAADTFTWLIYQSCKLFCTYPI